MASSRPSSRHAARLPTTRRPPSLTRLRTAPSEGVGGLGGANPQSPPDFPPRAGTTTLNYADEMRLSTITDTPGDVTTLTYAAIGRRSQAQQPFDSPNSTWIINRYSYDRNG